MKHSGLEMTIVMRINKKRAHIDSGLGLDKKNNKHQCTVGSVVRQTLTRRIVVLKCDFN